MNPPQRRELDLVLFGATGYTGALVAEHLLRAAPEGLRWGLAGRSLAKLEHVRDTLAREAPRAASLPLVVADSSDPASLADLAARARVVASTVGPYARYGTPLVAAAAEAGTDYCDLTGEPPWIRSIIARFHDAARASGARLVPCSGFDSIPSDLGVWMLSEHFAASGRRLASARYHLVRAKGGVSGGTAQSMIGVSEQLRDPAVRRALLDPRAFVPGEEGGPTDAAALFLPGFDRARRAFAAPFAMAGVNTRVVHRTNALLGHPYGERFEYAEDLLVGGGLAGLARVAATTAGMGLLFAGLAFPPTRALVAGRLPSSGQGPSAEQRRRGFMIVEIDGVAEDGARATLRIEGDLDPGYGLTAVMFGQSALALADDATPRVPGGVLTPASALGASLVARLRAQGMRFEIGDPRAR